MSAHQAVFPIKTMARVFKVSASGYYAWRGRPASARVTADVDLTRKIRTIHMASRKTYGAPRIHAELKADGVAIGKKRGRITIEFAGEDDLDRILGLFERQPANHARGDLPGWADALLSQR